MKGGGRVSVDGGWGMALSFPPMYYTVLPSDQSAMKSVSEIVGPRLRSRCFLPKPYTPGRIRFPLVMRYKNLMIFQHFVGLYEPCLQSSTMQVYKCTDGWTQ